jgi:glyoxylase-like metal-dependent hydrolase (beta-lactamase superfamily II)
MGALRQCSRPVFAVLMSMLAFFAVPAGSGSIAAQQTPAGPPSLVELIRVADDVYSFRYNTHITMFIVTADGVIAADPLGQQNPEAPNLLKAAIRSVTDQPVKYVVITHWGADHGMGGAAFADTAKFISHPTTAQAIAQANDPTTPVPDMLVTDQLMLELGGKQVGIYYPGVTQGPDYLVVHYPAGNLAFIVDFVRANAVPFRDFPTGNLEEWVKSLNWIDENLPFETLLLGHPPAVATKDALRETRQYLLDLKAAVLSARAAGHADNSEAMIAAVRDELTPKYGTWANFDSFLPLNVAGATRTISGM